MTTPAEALAPCRTVLSEAHSPTSFEDSNLVGNIYLTQYGAWQASVQGEFFHTIAPTSYSTDRGARGELCCVETSMSQRRDGMPFDTVLVRFSISTLTTPPSTSASRTSGSNPTRA